MSVHKFTDLELAVWGRDECQRRESLYVTAENDAEMVAVHQACTDRLERAGFPRRVVARAMRLSFEVEIPAWVAQLDVLATRH